MNDKTLYECNSHIEYLNSVFDPRKARRGIKAKFSEHLRIQPAFLSQVLSGKYSLSVEQADLANQFFEHSNEDSNFFILLVSRDRAGTSTLKAYYEEQLKTILQKRLLISERIGKKTEVRESAKNEYYSSWVYSAVHVICTIEGVSSKQDIARLLQLPIDLVSKVIEFLIENELIIKKNGKFEWTNSWVRIDKNSPHIIRHHSNWRIQAINNLEIQTNNDLHYSGVFSISQKTARTIKDLLMESVKENLKRIEESSEEDVYVLNVDFFSIISK